jgi:beta-glucosidase
MRLIVQDMRALALLVMSGVAHGVSDVDFYGQSPPVYPSRTCHSSRCTFLVHTLLTCSLSCIAEGKGTNGWAAAYASARDLVGQMTFEEKANLTRGFAVTTNVCAGNTGTVPRLGWPGMCLMDAGNGLRATDLVNSYPSGVHVGASWDKNLTYLRGWFMGKEFKAKGGELTPN